MAEKSHWLVVVALLWLTIGWFAPGCSAATLRSYTIRDREYVAVPHLAAHYRLGSNRLSTDRAALFQSAAGSLAVEADSRRIQLNGVAHWLAEPVIAHRGRLWISRTDVLKVLEPVLRPDRLPRPPGLRTVLLDPGHGGGERGARGVSGRTEKELTLLLAQAVRAALATNGIDVILTRYDDRTLSLVERVAMAKNRRADLFVSLHFNSGGGASGVETYCLPPAGAASTAGGRGGGYLPGNRYDELNVWLAHNIQRQLLAQTRAEDRGVRRARFLVLRDAPCPAVLVEAGFLSNPAEEAKILTATYRAALARGIAEGILAYRKSFLDRMAR